MLGAFRRRMAEAGIEIVSRATAEPEASRSGDLWRSATMSRKEPDASAVHAYGERLGADAVLVLWYEQSGTYCSRTDLDVRLFDVELERSYRERGPGADTSGIAEKLVSRFLDARGSGGEAPDASGGETVQSAGLGSAGAGAALAQRSRQQRYKIALPPPEGTSWTCDQPFDSASLLATIRGQMVAQGVTPAQYAYLVAPHDVYPGQLWRSSGVRKEADAQTAFQHAGQLEVDGVFTVWYEISGTYCSRLDFDVRLFDGALRKTYRERATNAGIEQAVEALVERFLEGRALARRAP